jgi:hypothetical protein
VTDKDPLILDFRNGSVLDGLDLDQYYGSGLDDEPVNWDDIDLENAFGLPPVLPPVRLPDDSDPVVADDLDLEGHGPALVTRLFLSQLDGVRIIELAGALKEAATADLAAQEADRQWREWADAHGDPLQLLLGQLERLGAISVTDDVARLEPLGVHAVRSKLERDHLFVPLLPAPGAYEASTRRAARR